MFRALLTYRLRRPVLAISACLALFAGVFASRIWPFADLAVIWLLAVSALLTIRRQGLLACAILAALAFSFGMYRGTIYVRKLAVHQSFHYQKVVVVGQATDDAVYGKRYQLEFTLGDVRVASPSASPLVGNLAIRGYGEAAVYRGDTVRVTGKLYPTRGNNLGVISFAELEVVDRGSSPVDAFRRKFAAGMQTALPEPAASFALGLVIGQRTTLPEEVNTELRHVGLTHIIAVSGYNLTVIVMACRRLLAGRSKYQATATCLVLIGMFLLITGSSPPIVRASIVSLLGLAVWYYGRSIKPHVLLLASAAVTVIANPLYLWGNVSWYLSFLAFYGVLVLAPLITKRIMGAKEPRLFTAVLVESMCANLLVLPYVLYIFGETSLVSLPANLLVVPFIPLAMVLVLVAGLAGMAIPFLAGWLAWPATVILTYMLDISSLLSRVPHSFVQGLGLSWRAMAALYATIELVILVLWLKTRTIRPQKS